VALYWIKNADSLRLAIAARPRGGDWLGDDLARLKNSGIEVLISMLTQNETEELGLLLEREGSGACGIDYLNFPIDDRTVPRNVQEFHLFVDHIAAQLKAGKAIAVHCRAGIGRSSMLAACALIRLGLTSTSALDLIQKGRGLSVPDTPEQRTFIERFGAGKLGPEKAF
jgi:protein-tyrosine phosphatase